MIKEIKELFITALSRAFNPIISSFILSWLVINYQIMLSVFSTLEYQKKIEIIKFQLSHSETAFQYPLVYALAYSLLIPWIDVIYTWFISKVNNRKERILIESQDSRTYDVDQAKRIFTDFRDEIKQHKDNYKTIYQNSIIESRNYTLKIKNTTEHYHTILLCYFFRDKEDPFECALQTTEIDYLESHKEEIKQSFIDLFPRRIYLLSSCIDSIINTYNSTGDNIINLNGLIENNQNYQDDKNRLRIRFIFDTMVALNILKPNILDAELYIISDISILRFINDNS